ncbi:MAG: DUF6089 family protein [Bacteroidota bacterium]
MRRYLLSLAACLATLMVLAQPRAEIGLLLGGAAYLGDLEAEDRYPNTELLEFTPSIYAALPIGYRWQVRASLLCAELRGDDRLHPRPEFIERDFAFDSKLWEGALQLHWEPFAKRRFPAEGGYKRIVSPYLFAGVGFSFFDTNTHFGNPGVDGFSEAIKMDQRAEESPAFVLPFGGGVRFDLSRRISLGLELGARKTFTDQLDGVSFAGNPDKDDWYVIGGLTLAYRWQVDDYDRDGFLDLVDQCPKVAGLEHTKGCPDSDGDGLADQEDRCPFQAGKVQAEGCPDSDYDGVPDFYDDCPDYPGDLSAKGCADQDGDGVPDDDDLCPNCPGEAALFGCLDSDGDGIEDSLDRCPHLAGPRTGQGCPYVDSDADGVFDGEDECPQLAGLATLNGCPDQDEDGVADHLDRCPALAGVASSSGCPAVTEDLQATVAAFTENVQFETGSNQLKKSSREKLRELVSLLTSYPYYDLKISGHTDDRGSDEANLRLSKARAAACLNFLSEEGIAKTRMEHTGYGENQPIADNNTAQGRAQNRRVNFELFVASLAQ